MDETFVSFPGYTFMLSWQPLCVLLIPVLAIYLLWLTRRGMPYAVALGLEKAWGAKFAALAGKIRMQGSMAATMAEYNHRLSGE